MWTCKKCGISFTHESLEAHVMVNHAMLSLEKTRLSPSIYACRDCNASRASIEDIAQHCLVLGHRLSAVRLGPDFPLYFNDSDSGGLFFTELEDVLTSATSKDKVVHFQLSDQEPISFIKKNTTSEAMDLISKAETILDTDLVSSGSPQSDDKDEQFFQKKRELESVMDGKYNSKKRTLPINNQFFDSGRSNEKTKRVGQEGDEVQDSFFVQFESCYPGIQDSNTTPTVGREDDPEVDKCTTPLERNVHDEKEKVDHVLSEKCEYKQKEREARNHGDNIGQEDREQKERGVRLLADERREGAGKPGVAEKIHQPRQMPCYGRMDRPRTAQCEYCPKAFEDRHKLAIHRRYHQGDRPFKCQLCPKAFVVNAVLKKHQMIHTGERPWPCSKCPKRFRIKANMIYHQDTQHY